MKRYLLIMCLIFAAFIITANAQPGQRLEAYRVAYITQKVNLSPDEAKVFWPVYDKFSAERRSLKEKSRLDRMELRNFSALSDQEADALLNELISDRQAELDLYKIYLVEFRKILPAQKVVALMRAEQDFKQELLDRLGRRPGMNGRDY